MHIGLRHWLLAFLIAGAAHAAIAYAIVHAVHPLEPGNRVLRLELIGDGELGANGDGRSSASAPLRPVRAQGSANTNSGDESAEALSPLARPMELDGRLDAETSQDARLGVPLPATPVGQDRALGPPMRDPSQTGLIQPVQPSAPQTAKTVQPARVPRRDARRAIEAPTPKAAPAPVVRQRREEPAAPHEQTASARERSSASAADRQRATAGSGQGTAAGQPTGRTTGRTTGRNGDSTTSGRGAAGDATSARNYYGRLATWLARHKRYPHQARRLGQEGTVKVTFTVSQDGRVLSLRITQSSGYRLLDREVEDMLRRATPLPRIPSSLGRAQLTITLPVAFALR